MAAGGWILMTEKHSSGLELLVPTRAPAFFGKGLNLNGIWRERLSSCSCSTL